MTTETIAFYGYMGDGTGHRLDEYTREETEDILRYALKTAGKPWDQAKFDEYWVEAMARKRDAFRPKH